MLMRSAPSARMTHGFEIHAVRVDDERAVVVRMVVRADAWRPVDRLAPAATAAL